MTYKWILAFLLTACVVWAVNSKASMNTDPPPILVLIHCMSVLNVMSDHVQLPEKLLWRSTARHMHEWLYEHAPVQDHDQIQELQHLLETHVLQQVLTMPYMKSHWFIQADTCQQALVQVMSAQA